MDTKQRWGTYLLEWYLFVCLNVQNLFSMQYSLYCMCIKSLYICLTISIPNISKVILCVQRTFSGVGLRSVVLSDMYPNEEYTLQIRCGAQKNFWKWGDWSELFSFKTSTTGKVLTCSRVVSDFCRFINHSILADFLCSYMVVLSFSSRCSWCVGMDEQGQHWTGRLEGNFVSLHFYAKKDKHHIQQPLISSFSPGSYAKPEPRPTNGL